MFLENAFAPSTLMHQLVFGAQLHESTPVEHPWTPRLLAHPYDAIALCEKRLCAACGINRNADKHVENLVQR